MEQKYPGGMVLFWAFGLITKVPIVPGFLCVFLQKPIGSPHFGASEMNSDKVGYPAEDEDDHLLAQAPVVGLPVRAISDFQLQWANVQLKQSVYNVHS